MQIYQSHGSYGRDEFNEFIGGCPRDASAFPMWRGVAEQVIYVR